MGRRLHTTTTELPFDPPPTIFRQATVFCVRIATGASSFRAGLRLRREDIALLYVARVGRDADVGIPKKECISTA